METKLIYKKIISIMNDVEAIGKNKTNTMQGYKFRGIDDMYNALHPLFAKHGVFISSEVIAGEREERQTIKGGTLLYSVIDVKFTFYAEDGSYVCSTIKGEAMDSGDKATNKAISVALKYALMQMFLIPTDEKIDTENESHEVLPKKEYPKEDDNKPWISDKQMDMVIERIKKGEIELKESTLIHFKVSKANREKLKAA